MGEDTVIWLRHRSPTYKQSSSLARRRVRTGEVDVVTIITDIGPHTKRGANHALEDTVALLPADGVAIAVGALVLPVESQRETREETGVKMLVCSLNAHFRYTHP
jgi:acetaldehyde dehydrogenase (acetylating)